MANSLNPSDIQVLSFTVTGADRWFEVAGHFTD